MSRKEIDVNEEELYRFIQALANFQRVTEEKFKAVANAWEKLDESWQGDSKNQFTKQFEITHQSVDMTLEAGQDALHWLERFDEIVRDFERDYY
jgi:uncharacterized protein YukE